MALKNNPQVTVGMTPAGAYEVTMQIGTRKSEYLYMTPADLVTGLAYHLRNMNLNDHEIPNAKKRLLNELLLSSSLYHEAVEFWREQYKVKDRRASEYRRHLIGFRNNLRTIAPDVYKKMKDILNAEIDAEETEEEATE